jgi:hypothetical protein
VNANFGAAYCGGRSKDWINVKNRSLPAMERES